MEFLRGWLLRHIIEEDRKFAPCLKQRKQVSPVCDYDL